jgi:hypothetical protein
MKLKISVFMAIGFGIVLSVVEVIRNWGNWQWWPFWLIDFIVAGLLISGGLLVLNKAKISRPFFSGAWGVAFGACYSSFWDHVYNFSEAAHGNISQTPLTYLIGLGLVSSIVGFILSLSEN